VIADVTKLPFKEKTFDCVVMLDLIEHLERTVASSVIQEAERIAKRRVALLTPNGFLAQRPYEDNPFQEHRSGWSVGELRKRGYVVKGLGGLRGIRGERTKIRHKPYLLWLGVSAVTGPLVYHWPRMAFHLFAVKEVGSSARRRGTSSVTLEGTHQGEV
jgi:hypothetical protein